MTRYTWRTGILEGFLLLAGVVFLIPLYALLNIALKPPMPTPACSPRPSTRTSATSPTPGPAPPWAPPSATAC